MNTTVPILMYHSVADDGPPAMAHFRVSLAAFRQQIGFLRVQGYRSVSLDEWAECIAAGRAPDGRLVVITFDDGYRNVAQNALPVLTETGFQATVFVVTGKVGHVADWDRLYGEPLALMDWHELSVWQRHGHAVGSHCVLHRNLKELSDAAIVADGREARATLHRELGLDVTAIAYPGGWSDERVRRLLADSGYRIGVDAAGGASRLGDPLMLLPRIEIFGDDDLADFARKLDHDDHGANAGEGATRMAMGVSPTLRSPDPSDNGEERLIRVEELRALSERIARLITELIAIKKALDDMQKRAPQALAMRRAALLERNLRALFRQMPTGAHPKPLTPYQEVSPGVQIGFPPEGRLTLAVETQPEAGIAADYPNRLRFSFADGEWLSVELSLAMTELAEAERLRLELGARVSRSVPCLVVLRRPELGDTDDTTVGCPHLDPAKPHYAIEGPFAVPPRAGENIRLLLIFQTGSAGLEVTLDYIDLHFAPLTATKPPRTSVA